MRFVLVWLAVVLSTSAAIAQPTYSREVSRILQGKCQRCHRPNDIAPFSLSTFEDASTWAADIRRVVSRGTMPPWKPVEAHGKFRDDFGLTDEERSTILAWIDAGARQGDPAELPEPLAATGEWELGDPDAVITMPESYEPPHEVKDTYRCFVLPTGLTEDRFIEAVQVKPGNRQIVHHVILFLDTTGQAEKLDAAEDGPGYTCFGGPGIDFGNGGVAAILDLFSALGGWVPGTRTQRLPEGVGLFLPANARVVMQVHYNPGGRPGPDQTRIGLWFSKTRIERRMRYIPLVNLTFQIPAGDTNHEVRAGLTIPPLLDMKLIQITPHMHLLGRKIRADIETRDGVKNLIRIDDWDFNWQNFYTYNEPVALPALSSLRLTCNFDNSADNPRNPSNPLRTVRWGEGTEDEMCLVFLGVTFDRENLLPFSERLRKK